jgi:hypothetical protein
MTRNRLIWSLCLLSFFQLALSGCLEPFNDEASSRSGLQAFTAKVDWDSGKQASVRLGLPASIMDADGKIVQAYPLEIAHSDGEATLSRVHWLAGDLFVIRSDLVCWTQGCPLEVTELSFLARGHWPPYGVGFEVLVDRGVTEQTLWGVRQSLSPTILNNSDRRTIIFDLDNWQGDERGKGVTVYSEPFLGFNGGFTFHSDSLVPSSMRWRGEDATFTVTEHGPDLPVIDPLRAIGKVPTISTGGKWFPGSNEPLMNLEKSADEAINKMMESDGEFASAIKADCLVHFSVASQYLSSHMLSLDATNTNTIPYQIGTYKSNATEVTTWRWNQQSSLLGESWYMEPRETKAGPPSNCTPGARPATAISLGMHKAHAEKLAWDDAKSPVIFAVSLQRQNLLVGDHPELSVLFMTGVAVPGGGGLIPVAQQAATNGLWVTIGGSPAELKRIGGNFGWPYDG